MVPKPDNAVAESAELLFPPGILRERVVRVMNGTIQLDDEQGGGAAEIDDEAADHMLAPERHAEPVTT